MDFPSSPNVSTLTLTSCAHRSFGEWRDDVAADFCFAHQTVVPERLARISPMQQAMKPGQVALCARSGIRQRESRPCKLSIGFQTRLSHQFGNGSVWLFRYRDAWFANSRAATRGTVPCEKMPPDEPGKCQLPNMGLTLKTRAVLARSELQENAVEGDETWAAGCCALR